MDPRILFIDSYDSFTFNLASLCRQSIPGCTIRIIKNDDYTVQELLPHLSYFSAIIIGPGPGSPDNPKDIGVVKDLWKIKDTFLLPIFGVCLGLQSLGIEFGARLLRLHTVKHGQVSQIHHSQVDIFSGIGPVRAVRYHSLHIEVQENGEIEELAWAKDLENGKVVMAIKHRTRPFWAVQYHPESVCTDIGGIEVLRNFWNLAQTWSNRVGRRACSVDAAANIGQLWPHFAPQSPSPISLADKPVMTTRTLDLPQLTVITVCELFGALNPSSLFAVLDSAAKPGRFSIIAPLSLTDLQVTHYACDSFVSLTRHGSTVLEELGKRTVWSWLASYVSSRKTYGGNAEIPFWGGFIGLLSYEMGVHTIHVTLPQPRSKTTRHPDVNLVFVERSIVLDSATGQIIVQSLAVNDPWVTNACAQLLKAASDGHAEQATKALRKRGQSSSPPIIVLPEKVQYIKRITQAKEHLYAGDSYELCLTAQTKISFPASPSSPPLSSWERYKSLRLSNPAPHSAYLRLYPTTLLSSSPERFLSFTRPPGSICQLRPIKGTMRKAPGITRAIAQKLLAGNVKEVAENLMIVDLIRHDLHCVVGEDVTVKQFCGVEEYETVWQLVSVIEGQLKSDTTPGRELGWDVLRSSLPPGSMTGAPKKRSVEILQTLEEDERGVYSGVFGYWCVGGGGDWSVTIRSCFKFDKIDTLNHSDAVTEEWVVGAGGAITALSDPEEEWAEMIVKLESVLRSFGVLFS